MFLPPVSHSIQLERIPMVQCLASQRVLARDRLQPVTQSVRIPQAGLSTKPDLPLRHPESVRQFGDRHPVLSHRPYQRLAGHLMSPVIR
jgi:hypothetical protein